MWGAFSGEISAPQGQKGCEIRPLLKTLSPQNKHYARKNNEFKPLIETALMNRWKSLGLNSLSVWLIRQENYFS